MKVHGIDLIWITVKNIEAAIKFYTQTMGLQLREFSKEFGWAELSGPDGAILGIAQESPECEVRAGNNAVITITVEELNAALEDLMKKGVTLVGEVIEVPGHVKMQTCQDKDGNTLQIVQKLD